MRYLIGFGFYALLCAATVACYKDEIMAKLKQCKNGAEVTEDEYEEFMKPLQPQNQEEKCLMACMMKEYKIIVDGAYDPVMATVVSEEIFKDDPIMAGKAKEMAVKCQSELPPNIPDECELANQLIQCVIRYEIKFGAVKS